MVICSLILLIYQYKISNSPKSTLSDVFCAWINRSALKTNDKIVLAKFAIKNIKMLGN